jgi:excisionase family DNA binding protein
MPITSFSDDEMDILAERIAERLLPKLIRCLQEKTRWAVSELQPEHYTAKDVGEMFSCSFKTVYKLAKEGKIDSMAVGKSGVRFSRNAIEKAQREGHLGGR